MKKKLICVLAVICIALAALGLYLASEYGLFGKISYTYSLDDSVQVEVTLNTTNGFKYSHELPFTVSQDGEDRIMGQFIYSETYYQFVSDARSGEHCTVLETGEKDGFEYIFWSFSGSEFNYAILFGDTGTGVILSNLISEESARECFDRLTFTLVQ